MLRAAQLLVVAALLLPVGCGGGDDAPAERGGATTEAAGARAGVRLLPVGRFDAPVHLAAAPGDRRRLFVVEQAGRIRVLRDGRRRPAPFLDIAAQVTAGGEQGLLSVAFAPDYARSGRFYVYFTDRSARQRLVEYRRSARDPERADPRSARLVFVHADHEPNHNGGLALFGPDGLLYVGTGDGGGGDDQHGRRGNAQDLASPLGKILRLDPTPSAGRGFTVPPDNPFAGRRGARGEVYAYGLRNPWRFSFDRRTGDLVIGDVGQDAVEEIDFAARGRAAGANFGWRPFEGRQRNFADEPAPAHVRPALELSHDDGNCSVTGGYVVRDPALPALRGHYVYGDFCAGELRVARLGAGRAEGDRALGPRVESLSSFGEDADGRIYALSLAGPVYRLAAG